jgi:hypothetical protein
VIDVLFIHYITVVNCALLQGCLVEDIKYFIMETYSRTNKTYFVYTRLRLNDRLGSIFDDLVSFMFLTHVVVKL